MANPRTKSEIAFKRKSAYFFDTASTISLAAAPYLGMMAAGTDWLANGLIGVATATGLACQGLKYRNQVHSEPLETDLYAVEHSLRLLHKVMIHCAGESPHAKIRLSIFRPENDKLRRITSYIGDGEFDGEPDEIPVSVGVVGSAARNFTNTHAKLPAGGTLADYLMSKWGFTAEMAAKVKPDRASWYGVPIGSKSTRLLGVLMCDSCEADFFRNKNCPRRKVAEWASISLAEALQA